MCVSRSIGEWCVCFSLDQVLGLLCARRGRKVILRNLLETHTPLPDKRPSDAKGAIRGRLGNYGEGRFIFLLNLF